MKNLKRLLSLIAPHKKLATLVVFLSGVYGVMTLIMPNLMSRIVDTMDNVIKGNLTAEAGMQMFIWLMLFYAAYRLFDNVLYGVMDYLAHKLAVKGSVKLVEESAHKFTRLHMGWFEEVRIGEEMRKMGDADGAAYQAIYDFSVSLLPMIITIITLTTGLALVDWRIAVIMFVVMPIFIWYVYRTTKAMQKKYRTQRKLWERAFGVIHDAIDNIWITKLFSAEWRELKALFQAHHKAESMSNKLYLQDAKISFIKQFIFIFSIVPALFLGGYLTLIGTLTLAQFILVTFYVQRLQNPLFQIVRVYERFGRDLVSVYRVFEVWDVIEKVQDIPDAPDLKVSKGEIEFRAASFKYADKQTLKNLSFTIKAGEKVALVGHSGAGKSTVMNLLTRLWDLESGQILIDGQDIAKVKQASLRSQIGMVMQNLNLFQKTIRENIIYGNPKASKKELEKAAKAAHAHMFIQDLPKGYQSTVGQKGVKLSGGEKQRISIARVFLKDVPIIILDEATSHLDSESEAYIQDALQKLTEQKTTLIIAHRLSTVRHCDRIIVLDRGGVVETGSHQQLLRKKGAYSRLYNLQSGAFSIE